MIFKKSVCPVCNQEIKHKIKLTDGVICQSCAAFSVNIGSDTITTIQSRYSENQKRLSVFSATRSLNAKFFDSVFIDDNNKLFYIDNLRLPVKNIYRFDEVIGYEMRSVNQTITVNSDGSRTVVTQNNAVPCLTIRINIGVGVKEVNTAKPPTGLNNFLDTCLMNNNLSDPRLSPADELVKFKQILDAGIITQQEFDEQKRKLLNQ